MQFQRITLLKLCHNNFIVPKVFMSAQSRKDFEAIMTYNKLRKKPIVADQTYCMEELKRAKNYFDKINEYRKRSEEGFKPSKLFMVWQIASLVGRPKWEKETMIKLGLVNHDRKVRYAIVKNTASNNEILWSIKHLIRVKPITFPDGFPSEEDLYKTFLKQNGELIIESRLNIDCKELERDAEMKEKTLDHRLIQEDLRLMWWKHYPKMY